MITIVQALTEKVMSGALITYKEAKELAEKADQKELLEAANSIRTHFRDNTIDFCTIMNAKSGKCSENCAYCGQSAHFKTEVKEYDLVSIDEALVLARENKHDGAHRFSLVTSGKALSDVDLEKLLPIYQALHEEVVLKLCGSHGLLSVEQAKKLKEAGVERYHHNLETGRRFFREVCTTHSYDDRVETIVNAQKAGLEVCSGGIIGLGETMGDRLEMAFELQHLAIKSIPINILNPIKGTPLENVSPLISEEIFRTMAVFRFIIPNSDIRYAGGRNVLGEKQKDGLKAGINAMLVGNYLTTVGNKIVDDISMAQKAGFIVKK